MNFIQPNSYTSSFGHRLKKIILPILAVMFVCGASGSAIYFYQKNKTANKNTNSANQANQDTVAAVEKLILLPTDELPTIATVTDPVKLSEQSFFDHAKVGDKVLIYVKAKKAILYDPSANKLIEVAPLNLEESNSAEVSGGTTSETK